MWRNYEEVFDMAIVGGRPILATDGGLIRVDPGAWTVEPMRSPAGLRSIDQVLPLAVRNAGGRNFVMTDGNWGLGSIGRRRRTIDSGLEVGPEEPWLGACPSLRGCFPNPPPAHVYSLLSFGGKLLAGTSHGLYISCTAGWQQVKLPSAMPVSRPNGIAMANGTYVLGGLGGLYVGKPEAWKQVSADSVRQVYQDGETVWVVYGSGALDRLDPKTDQLYPDVMTGSSRRPWTSWVGRCDTTLLIGGMGGWSEKEHELIETYPPELSGEIVTTMTGMPGTRWIGTEKTGLLRVNSAGIHRWNPGNGLLDTWVTSLCHMPSGLIVGTMHFGLFRLVGESVAPVRSPTQRVTCLGVWNRALVVGGMDGAWIRRGPSWDSLNTNGEETTSIGIVGGRLCITTACGVYFYTGLSSV